MSNITWQQLVNPGDGGAFRALDSAAGSVNAGFDAVNKVIAQRQAANQFGADMDRTRNTQAYLDAVQGATTPEAVAALQASGKLDALRAAVDPRDLGLIRPAVETRMSSTRTNLEAAQKFAEDQYMETNKPLVTKLQTMAAQGAAPADLMAAAGDAANHPIMAKVITDAVTAKQLAETNKAKIALEGAQGTLAGAQATNIPAQLKVEQERNRLTARGQDVTMYDSLVRGVGGAGGSGGGAGGATGATAGVDGGAATVTAGLGAMFKDDPGKAQVMDRMLATAMNHPDPQKAAMLRNLPQDVVLRVAQEASNMTGTGKYNPLDWGASGRIQDMLLKQLDNPSVLGETIANIQRPQRLQKQTGEVADLRQKLMASIMGGGAVPGAVVPAAGAAPVAGDPGPVQTTPDGVGPTMPAAAASPAVADFRLDPGLEKAAEAQKLQMSLGSRRLFTPEVEKYLKAKDAAVAVINAQGPRADLAAEFNSTRTNAPAYGSLFDAAARKAEEDAAKKAK